MGSIAVLYALLRVSALTTPANLLSILILACHLLSTCLISIWKVPVFAKVTPRNLADCLKWIGWVSPSKKSGRFSISLLTDGFLCIART